MNKKLMHGFRTNMALSCICLVGFTIAAFSVSVVLGIVEALVTALVIYVGARRNRMAAKSVRQYLDKVNGGLDSARSSNMLYTPLPMLVFDLNSEEILWGNDLFLTLAGNPDKIFESSVREVVPQLDTHWLREGKRESSELVVWDHRTYRVFGGVGHDDTHIGAALATTYWMDVTDTEQMRSTLEITRPVVSIVMVDNYEELMKACPESQRSALLAELQTKLNAWVAPSGGLLLSYDRDRYLYIFEEKDFTMFAEQKFDVLESVRAVESGGVGATLSIGVGRDGDTYDQLFKNASLALEMALSRGGDQAVVKDRNNFEFFGGRAKATERRTKVKSRVMAGALGDLMDDARNIYVMGHKYADMDCLGAAVGICAIARKRGKKCQIVMDTENNAVHPILKKLQKLPEYEGAFISGDTAFLHAQATTLLVVLDTNRPDSVENEQLLDSCTRVAVIDHHRRGSNYIDKMALNYHEPYASSASELVTELMQYMTDPADLLVDEAEALLAGIVLDTKNFTNRTGGRTFEAAAYLRRCGADTQDVQKLFQSNLAATISRHDIMRQAEIIRGNIALVALEDTCDRVVAAKAADELLTIQGVEASIVTYRAGDGAYMSARSLGEVNVQVILEALGGGGNSTTAGGMVSGMEVSEVKEKLLEAIDNYFAV